MERIVLGYDGSPAAAAALRWTAARAVRGATTVDVVLVAAPCTAERAAERQPLSTAEDHLLEHVPGLDVAVHRPSGSATTSIAQAADAADLVVVGMNPGHYLRVAAGGWMPLRLSHRSAVPVCMIPVGWTPTDEPVTAGVASDDTSDSALAFAAGEAIRRSTGLRLVHSWLMPAPALDTPTVMGATPEQVVEHHRQVLERAAEGLGRQHPTLSIDRELIRDSRSGGLLRFGGRSSLIVIGTHRRGMIVGSLLGSVGQEILWRAECPVCVVPPRFGVNALRAAAASPVAAGPGR